MFSRVRKRITYGNAALTLAAVFAMTGGAFAANKVIITSIHQISKKVQKELKGQTGPAGAKGSDGAPGATGKEGPLGKEGKPGSNGVNGESVAIKPIPTSDARCSKFGGSEFLVAATEGQACNGKTGYVKTLPKGASETGQWGWFGYVTISFQFFSASISFPIPLEADLPNSAVHFIGTNEELAGELNEAAAIKNGECSGSAKAPEAASGNLCVFAGLLTNEQGKGSVSFGQFRNAEDGKEDAGVGGANMLFSVSINPAEKELTFADGTWVVTA
jgi:hypothetical protein